eukprot:3667730-Pleurochrysis_carterae.AAC.1
MWRSDAASKTSPLAAPTFTHRHSFPRTRPNARPKAPTQAHARARHSIALARACLCAARSAHPGARHFEAAHLR